MKAEVLWRTRLPTYISHTVAEARHMGNGASQELEGPVTTLIQGINRKFPRILEPRLSRRALLLASKLHISWNRAATSSAFADLVVSYQAMVVSRYRFACGTLAWGDGRREWKEILEACQQTVLGNGLDLRNIDVQVSNILEIEIEKVHNMAESAQPTVEAIAILRSLDRQKTWALTLGFTDLIDDIAREFPEKLTLQLSKDASSSALLFARDPAIPETILSPTNGALEYLAASHMLRIGREDEIETWKRIMGPWSGLRWEVVSGLAEMLKNTFDIHTSAQSTVEAMVAVKKMNPEKSMELEKRFKVFLKGIRLNFHGKLTAKVADDALVLALERYRKDPRTEDPIGTAMEALAVYYMVMIEEGDPGTWKRIIKNAGLDEDRVVTLVTENNNRRNEMRARLSLAQ